MTYDEALKAYNEALNNLGRTGNEQAEQAALISARRALRPQLNSRAFFRAACGGK